LGTIINYASVRFENDDISDDVTLILLNLLYSVGIRRVTVAGLDGYALNTEENYFNKRMSMGSKNKDRVMKNNNMRLALKQMSSKMEITFLTPSLYTK
jgi:4-hydroxy 2-oxovalerate aldolase